jgi:hypothetical protein
MTEFKEGDVLVCKNAGGNRLTNGDHYVAKEDSLHGETRLINDEGDSNWYSNDRFELASPKPTIDFTKPLETVSGEPFVLLTAEGRGSEPIVGYVGSSETLSTFNKNGKYYGDNDDSYRDLRNVVPKPLTGEAFVNVYKTSVSEKLFASGLYATAESADLMASEDRVSRMKITLVAGQFD